MDPLLGIGAFPLLEMILYVLGREAVGSILVHASPFFYGRSASPPNWNWRLKWNHNIFGSVFKFGMAVMKLIFSLIPIFRTVVTVLEQLVLSLSQCLISDRLSEEPRRGRREIGSERGELFSR